MPSNAQPVTMLLDAAAAGDSTAAEQLLPILYTELRAVARSLLSKTPPGQTLQPTALVHEAYLRLVGQGEPNWNSRGHFFGAAARAMRNILVEQARRKGRVKHGGHVARENSELDRLTLADDSADVDLVALDSALDQLEHENPRQVQIVHLRYFAGLTVDQTAAVLGVSVGTVERQWRFIVAWLHRQLADSA